MEILCLCPACAQHFRFPSAPGETYQYFTGRELIPAFPPFSGTHRSPMEEPCAVVTYLISSLRRQVQCLLLAIQVSNNFKDGESTQSQ